MAQKTKPIATRKGRYIDLIERKSGLELVPTPAGRQEAKEMLEKGKQGIDDMLAELLEDHRGNGWDLLSGDDVGAMTDAPIVTSEVLQNESGDRVLVGKIYYLNDYATRNEIEDFAEGKTVTFAPHGKHLTEKTLAVYDSLRWKEDNGQDVDWNAFTKKFAKEYSS